MTVRLEGQRFKRLLVLNKTEGSGGAGNQLWWDCICDCGTKTSVRGYCLRRGSTGSCGCLGRENISHVDNTKHGYYNSRTYHTWEGMKQRCLNPEATRYPTYGGVGVTVCDRWLKFEHFLSDMGDRPEGKTLDRIDPFGNYEPNNCRWATPMEQAHNQRRHKLTEGGIWL